jgi:hypothetical protein
LLDYIRSHKEGTDDESAPEKLYFQHCTFIGPALQMIETNQRQLNILQFHGKDFWCWANQAKHELPWIGILSHSSRLVKTDISDNTDPPHGFVQFLQDADDIVGKIINGINSK